MPDFGHTRNSEGYTDPTAYHGLKSIVKAENAEQKRISTLVFVLKYIISLAGFHLINRIELKDKVTGREYK